MSSSRARVCSKRSRGIASKQPRCRSPSSSRRFDQIASALDALHERGVIHRDIKPANIIRDPFRNRAVLVDVGIARRYGQFVEGAGTPGYCAPEVIAGGEATPALRRLWARSDRVHAARLVANRGAKVTVYSRASVEAIRSRRFVHTTRARGPRRRARRGPRCRSVGPSGKRNRVRARVANGGDHLDDAIRARGWAMDWPHESCRAGREVRRRHAAWCFGR